MDDRFMFRAWHHGAGDPRVGGRLQYSNFSKELFWRNVENEPLGVEVMACTGLKDKNGKLIFEGDIITPVFEGDEPCPSEVVFEDGAFRKLYPKWDLTLNKPLLNQADVELLNLTILGNIHEHKHLLEK